MIIVGEKRSAMNSPLYDFEQISSSQWNQFKEQKQIPDGFVFLAGATKYKNTPGIVLRAGKESIFLQSFLPHKSDEGLYSTRGFGRIYTIYEPANRPAEDVVLEESAIYLVMPDNKIMMLLNNGEHRNAAEVKQMFCFMRQLKGFKDFAPTNSLPHLYEVTFKERSRGYFLKGQTYQVWATPIGIPDVSLGEIAKGWMFCDINCGILGIIKSQSEEFIPLAEDDGTRIGQFKLRNHHLVFED